MGKTANVNGFWSFHPKTIVWLFSLLLLLAFPLLPCRGVECEVELVIGCQRHVHPPLEMLVLTCRCCRCFCCFCAAAEAEAVVLVAAWLGQYSDFHSLVTTRVLSVDMAVCKSRVMYWNSLANPSLVGISSNTKYRCRRRRRLSVLLVVESEWGGGF